jgi:cytochrome b
MKTIKVWDIFIRVFHLAKHSLSFVSKAYADRDKSHTDLENHDDRTYNRQDRNEDVKDKKKEHFWKDIHEFFASVLIFLIAIHICGVIASSYFHRENLILAMFTGEKN